MPNIFNAGEHARVELRIRNAAGALVDPTDTPTITITDPLGVEVTSEDNMTREDTGKWYFLQETTTSFAKGNYSCRMTVIDGAVTTIQYQSFLLDSAQQAGIIPAASVTTPASGLTNVYRASAFLSVSQAIPNNIDTVILFDTEYYDPNSNYNPVTGEYTVPVSGYYDISGLVNIVGLTDDAYDSYQAHISVDGVITRRAMLLFSWIATQSFHNRLIISEIGLHLTVGQVVTIRGFHTSVDTLSRLAYGEASPGSYACKFTIALRNI